MAKSESLPDQSEWNHTTDLRERVAKALAGTPDRGFPNDWKGYLGEAEAAIEAVGGWFRDNGYLHADGVLGIGKEASR